MSCVVLCCFLCSILLIVGVLVIGIVGIVYLCVCQVLDVGIVVVISLVGVNMVVLKGMFDLKVQVLIFVGYQFVIFGVFIVVIYLGQLLFVDYGIDSKDVVGIELDIVWLIVDVLGLKLVIVLVVWVDWLLGLELGKYDVVLLNVMVIEECKKKFDFFSYCYDFLGIYMCSDGFIQKIEKFVDVVGLKVVVGVSINQDQILWQWDWQNIVVGLKLVEYQYFDDVVVGCLVVIIGCVDVLFEFNVIGVYLVCDGKVWCVGLFFGGWLNVVVILVIMCKGSGLVDVVMQVLNIQIGSGIYVQVLKCWNVVEEVVLQLQINLLGLLMF